MTIRPATSADYPVFARLFPELATGDRVIDETRWLKEIAPTMLVAGDGNGYAYFTDMEGNLVYVRHIVTAPDARRRGVARALMEAIASHREGAKEWCLNVRPNNVAAIALYESFGLTRRHSSRALRIAWSNIPETHAVARIIRPEEDARIESEMQLLPGHLSASRARAERVTLALEEGGRLVGAAVFDPAFPGTSPFRVARPDLALVFLGCMRPFARPNEPWIDLTVENRPDIVEALIAAGATVRLEILHMRGPIPT